MIKDDESTDFNELSFEEQKAYRLRVKLAHELKGIITKPEYAGLSFNYFVADDETGSASLGGNMCPVCAATALMMLCIQRNLQHNEPELREAAEKMKVALLGQMEVPKTKMN